jgi:hypothetical protein
MGAIDITCYLASEYARINEVRLPAQLYAGYTRASKGFGGLYKRLQRLVASLNRLGRSGRLPQTLYRAIGGTNC